VESIDEMSCNIEYMKTDLKWPYGQEGAEESSASDKCRLGTPLMFFALPLWYSAGIQEKVLTYVAFVCSVIYMSLAVDEMGFVRYIYSASMTSNKSGWPSSDIKVASHRYLVIP